jgi:hypothetical protein
MAQKTGIFFIYKCDLELDFPTASTAWDNQVVKIAVPYILYIFLPDNDKHEDSYPLRCAFYTLLSNM